MVEKISIASVGSAAPPDLPREQRQHRSRRDEYRPDGHAQYQRDRQHREADQERS